MDLPIYHIDLPKPPIGNKIFLAQQHGVYVLERGPCSWRAMANTHMGNGSITVYDGVPDERGLFPVNEKTLDLIRNGRPVFNANPPILGMWMFDGGMYHGLTLILPGGHMAGVSPCVTITWAPLIIPQRQIVETPKIETPPPPEPKRGPGRPPKIFG